MNSMRLRPLRTPEKRASRERQLTEAKYTAEKVSVFGQKPLVIYPRGTIPPRYFCLPLEGKPRKVFAAGRLIICALTCPRCATCTPSFPLLPHAVVVSPPYSGGQGGTPLVALSFRVFLSPEKEKRIGSDAVGKSLLRKQNLPDIIFHEAFGRQIGNKKGTLRRQKRDKKGTTNEKMCDTIILPTEKAPCGDAYGHCPTAPLTPLQNTYPDAWGRNSHSPTSRSQGRRYRKD